MKPISKKLKPQKLGWAALLTCLFLPFIFLALFKSNYHDTNSGLCRPIQNCLRLFRVKDSISSDQLASLQQPIQNYLPSHNSRDSSNSDDQPDAGNLGANLHLVAEEKQEKNESQIVHESIFPSSDENQKHESQIVNESIFPSSDENQGEHKSSEGMEMINLSLHLNGRQEENTSDTGILIQESTLICDFSEPMSDTCTMDGDIRVISDASTIILSTPTLHDSMENTTYKIKPYARKWEPPVMETVRELTLKPSAALDRTPRCNVTHDVPAIAFSTGGFLGNFFHDLTDVLIPLFVASHEYRGEVQFIVTNFNSKWLNKYQPILERLSRHEIINMDTDERVHCFRRAQVGLKNHKVMGIDPSKSSNGYSMTDFREFLRTCFSLKRESLTISNHPERKPRLLMLLRKGSRSLINEKKVIKMAKKLGYNVVTGRPEDMKDLSRFAQIVNSCDVMMGVHGAGLANMVFLPANATLIQIVPWGELKWASRHDYGDPTPDMRLKYVEYEIKEEESSLIDEYPRDHPVFKDPISIHKQGWNELWSIFLNKQKVKLDVVRLRGVLLGVLQSLKK